MKSHIVAASATKTVPTKWRDGNENDHEKAAAESRKENACSEK